MWWEKLQLVPRPMTVWAGQSRGQAHTWIHVIPMKHHALGVTPGSQEEGLPTVLCLQCLHEKWSKLTKGNNGKKVTWLVALLLPFSGKLHGGSTLIIIRYVNNKSHLVNWVLHSPRHRARSTARVTTAPRVGNDHHSYFAYETIKGQD